MTIRQMFLAQGTTAAGISYKSLGEASATSMTLPTHADGDMIVMMAFGPYTGDLIVVPSGWTQINQLGGAGDSNQAVVAWKKATSGAETSGTWTNASYLYAVVYDGVGSIGGAGERKSSGSTVYWPAVTMSVSDGSSWVVGMNYATGFVTGLSSAPTGMTNRDTFSTIAALHDTASGVSSWSEKTTTMGSSGDRYVFTFELVAE